MNRQPSPRDQLGFDALLVEAEADNVARVFKQETAHLPGDWTEAVAHHRRQIDDHHAAMLANAFEEAMAIRKDAHLLAKKLNCGAAGILAGPDAPGRQLDTTCAAEPGAVPLWGQSGAFEIEAADMRLAVDMEGMFGIGASAMSFLGFSVRCVDPAKPFLSETGYRSFLGCTVEPREGMTTADFVRRVIETFVERDLNGRLVRIAPRYASGAGA